MKNFDYSALYIMCDGSMAYDSKNSGGIGYVIKFPEAMQEEDISGYSGIYVESNIERLELEAIIQGMEAVTMLVKKRGLPLHMASRIVVITDRHALSDTERTGAYRIRAWRSRGGKNHEGKEIKNWDLLNMLDKTRTRLSSLTKKFVSFEYRRRKDNKAADKLSKKGRTIGIGDRKIALEGHKIGTRKFDGREVSYGTLREKETIGVNVFRKQPLREQWEVNAEIVDGSRKGQRLKIYTDLKLAEKLQRGNQYDVRIRRVFTRHIVIYRTISKRKE